MDRKTIKQAAAYLRLKNPNMSFDFFKALDFMETAAIAASPVEPPTSLDYELLVKKDYASKVKAFRHFVYKESLSFGESVMPEDVLEILNRSYNGGIYYRVLEKGFTSPYGKLLLLKEIYESLGDIFLPYEINQETLKKYFP